MKFAKALSFLLISFSSVQKAQALDWNYDLGDAQKGPNNWGAFLDTSTGQVGPSQEGAMACCTCAYHSS